MGRPKADLCSYSPWGCIPIPPPGPPNPLWLPIIPAAGAQTWSDLAMWALGQPNINPVISLFTNFYQPDQASTLADFTPPTAAGLTAEPLGVGMFLGLNPCARAIWQCQPPTWTAGGAGLPVAVWGYYVYCNDPITNLPGLLWAQRLVTHFAFNVAGDTLTFPLTISFGAC